MKSIHILHTFCAVTLFVVTSPAVAQDKGNAAFGAHIGSLGFGPDLSYSVSPMLTLRGTGNFLSLDYDENVDGIDYDLDVDLMSAGALMEFHPLRTGFHFSLGAFYNDNSAGLGATANSGSTIGSFTVPSGQSVGLRGDLEVEPFSPYFGVGWDSTFTSRSNWSFTFQAGVLYQGDPDVTLRQTSGPAVSQSDLDAEAQSVEDDLELLQFYPVFSIGLSYRF